jgi:hypothetical protein
MGEKALKTITIIRKSPKDYKQIKGYALQRLDNELCNTGCRWLIPHDAPKKLTFGDLDVLITWQPGFDAHDIREWISWSFHPNKLICNGRFFSFNIPGFGHARDFQINFITVPAGQFEIHHFFLSWGDYGMLIGRIAGGPGPAC